MSKYGPHVQHTVYKDGRQVFRFRVNANLRPHGWPKAIVLYEQTLPCPLTNDVLDHVRDRSIALLEDLRARRVSGVQGRTLQPVPDNDWSRLGAALTRSYWWDGLSQSSRTRYRSHFHTIARDFHDRPGYGLSTLTLGAVEQWARARGFSYHTVINLQGAINRLLERAVAEGLLVSFLPICLKVKKPVAGPVVLWTHDHIAKLTALFDQRKHPDMATLMYLAYETGQRLGDLRQLRYGLDYENGALHFLANKTGQRVMLKLPPYLVERIESRRRREKGLLILSKRGKPYTTTSLAAYFRETLELTQWDGPVLKLRHLRHTAVVNFARAGCTIPQIASVTRHSLKAVHQIVAHYLPQDPVLADQAMALRAGVAVLETPQTLMIEGAQRVFTGDLSPPAKPTAGRRRRYA